MQQAVPAPYGRGEETIVDATVRRVWQIDPTQCAIRNPAWETCMGGIVEAVKQAFGIDNVVQWDFYKLLIYEQGSFFIPHRDSEKVDGMFATLVVCLPSRHQGGTPRCQPRRRVQSHRFQRRGGGIHRTVCGVLYRLQARNHPGDQRL